MCGIVGYVGTRLATPVLLSGLFNLEYRGYDSAGLALKEQDALTVFKKAGRINALEKWLCCKLLASSCGIGHTRWATHGEPSNSNSHPHTDEFNKVAVVHNGIIENFDILKSKLIDEGIVFKSQTDTEVVAHLISKYRDLGAVEAVRKACSLLEGSFALAVLFADETEQIVAARKDSPLVIGYGKGENFLASDTLALLEYTDSVQELQNGEIALLSAGSVRIFTKERRELKLSPRKTEIKAGDTAKGNFPHFMIKEINQIPQSINDTIDFLALTDSLKRVPEGIFRDFNAIYIVACGTALHAGFVFKALLERFLRVTVFLDFASEFRYKNPIIDESTLCFFISQSGETADTLAGLNLARERGAKTIAVTNVPGSTICGIAEFIVPTRAGPEIAVASTKAYSAQLAALYALVLHIARLNNKTGLNFSLEDIKNCGAVIGEFLRGLNLDNLVMQIAEKESVYYIGRGLDYFTVLEGALKLKEIAYIHCEALACGELKHGTLALIEPGTYVLCLITQSNLMTKSINAVHEVRSRGAKVVMVTQFDEAACLGDFVIKLPQVKEELMPLIGVVPLQLLAYKTAAAKKVDPDKPRNLAKSVTVE